MDSDGQNDGHSDGHKQSQSYRRIELITGTPSVQRRSAEERARIVAESFEPGANISAVARRHGVNVGLLHYWRKRAKAMACETRDVEGPQFVPVAISDSVDSSALRNPSIGRMAEALESDLYCSDIFLFRPKRMDRIKMIVWDGSGMVLITKWLEEGRFTFHRDGAVVLSAAQLSVLLAGLDWTRVGTKAVKRPTKVG
jgi:transposase